jgi:hypothetical protein
MSSEWDAAWVAWAVCKWSSLEQGQQCPYPHSDASVVLLTPWEQAEQKPGFGTSLVPNPFWFFIENLLSFFV